MKLLKYIAVQRLLLSTSQLLIVIGPSNSYRLRLGRQVRNLVILIKYCNSNSLGHRKLNDRW